MLITPHSLKRFSNLHELVELILCEECVANETKTSCMHACTLQELENCIYKEDVENFPVSTQINCVLLTINMFVSKQHNQFDREQTAAGTLMYVLTLCITHIHLQLKKQTSYKFTKIATSKESVDRIKCSCRCQHL